MLCRYRADGGGSSNVTTGTQVEGTQEGSVMETDQFQDQPLSGTTDTGMGVMIGMQRSHGDVVPGTSQEVLALPSAATAVQAAITQGECTPAQHTCHVGGVWPWVGSIPQVVFQLILVCCLLVQFLVLPLWAALLWL